MWGITNDVFKRVNKQYTNEKMSIEQHIILKAHLVITLDTFRYKFRHISLN